MTWALITGASGGLGQEFARALAERGNDLVLVARSGNVMEALAAGLRERDGVQVVVLPTDLSEEANRNDLARTLADRGIQIGILVNNAGFATIGPVAQAGSDRLNDEISLNCTAVAHLTNLLLPSMLAAGYGRIINVASTAAFQPIPTMAVYAATKAFVLSFSQALWHELRGTGVRVLALCPGSTDTGFWRAAGDDKVLVRRRGASKVVELALSAVERAHPVVIDGTFNRIQASVARRAPIKLVLAGARATVSPRSRS